MNTLKNKKFAMISNQEMSMIVGGKWVTISVQYKLEKCYERDENGDCLNGIYQSYQLQQKVVLGKGQDTYRTVADN